MQQLADELRRKAANARNAEYRKLHPDRVKAWQQRYRDRNPETFRRSQRDYKRKRYASDPDYRLLCQLKSRLSKVVGRGSAVTAAVRMCGCSMNELRNHIERMFEPGMSWEKRSEWHIDHTFPLCAIDPTDPVQVRAANNWRNLRPMWAADNWKKNALVTDESRLLFASIVSRLASQESVCDQ